MATSDRILTALAAFESRLIEHLDRRFEEHASGLKLEMNARFDALHRRLDHLEVEYQMLKAGMARIEQDVALLKTAYGELRATLEDQRAAIARLEAEVALIKAAVTRLEAEIVEDRSERRQMREELDALRLRVGDLDTRVKQLEARLPAR